MTATGGVGGLGAAGSDAGVGSDTDAGEQFDVDTRMLVGGIELWDLAIVEFQFGAWTDPTGWGTNPRVYFPSAGMLASTTVVSASCVLFENLSSPTSERGASPITLSALPDNYSYVVVYDDLVKTYTGEGTSTRPAWGSSTGELVVTADDTQGQPVSVSVPAPPLIKNPGWFLGAPTGLDTTIHAPEGSFDVVRTMAYAKLPTGDTGVHCEYRHDDMQLVGGERITPLFDAEARSALTSRGITSLNAPVAGLFRRVRAPGFLPGADVEVRAGRVMVLNDACVRDRNVCP